MMRIRATCRDCGDIILSEHDIEVRYCFDTNQCSYAFCCPECNVRDARDCHVQIARLLTTAGCGFTPWYLPVLSRRDGPKLTFDDLIAFHLADLDEAFCTTFGGEW